MFFRPIPISLSEILLKEAHLQTPTDLILFSKFYRPYQYVLERENGKKKVTYRKQKGEEKNEKFEGN